MKPMRRAPAIELTHDERRILEVWSRGRSTPVRLVLRAKIVLAAAAGKQNQDIAVDLSTSQKTVSLWRARFAAERTAGIEKDAPRPGRNPSIPTATVELILRKTTQEKPRGATHWSTRTMAKVAGVSKATVQRIWTANGLKPHLVKTFKVSNDPQFATKVRDVVGLYLDPPEHALVLSCDEKTQIQALDRTQKGLPHPSGSLRHDDPRLQA
jgi:transposase